MFCLRGPGVFCAYRQAPTRRVFALRFSSSKAYDPLRILFCGSDEFSIASLKALHAAHLQHPDRIASIDVVCRPGKKVGRGRNIVREGNASILCQRQSVRMRILTRSRPTVPIKAAASELSLPIHEIDTFKGWTVIGTYILRQLAF